MKIAVEQISKYHPDKYADAISDEILKGILAEDTNALCGIEVMVKDKKVIVGGEVSTIIDDYTLANIVYFAVKEVSEKLNYEVEETFNFLGKQSPQINKAVLGEEIGAGDQGIVVGYANRAEIDIFNRRYSPYSAKLLADDIIQAIENEVGKGLFKGDAKCQVMFDDERFRITEIVVSVCHCEVVNGKITPLALVRDIVEKAIIKPLLLNKYSYGEIETEQIKITINPAGEWTIGGPTADCGVTGRKLVCDAYGPQVPIGGGAQSGKDLTKVDRSGAIVARWIAINLLNKNDNATDVLVEISYAIGKSEPTGVCVKLNGIENKNETRYVTNNYDLTPSGLIKFIKENNIDFYKSLGRQK